MKTCSQCLLSKPLDDFSKGRPNCKPCRAIETKKWREANKEKALAAVRKWQAKPENKIKQRVATDLWIENNKQRWKEVNQNAHLQRNYGISLETYREMYVTQEGKCAVCKEANEVLCVDHNHSTGEVRQLLCRRCNSGIGLFEENTELLLSAVKYIAQWNAHLQRRSA